MKLLLTLAALPLFAQHADLTGEWRIQMGDDPRYAQSDFDDRNWETVLLPWRTRLPLGTYWLRREVLLQAPTTEPLALGLGSIDAEYQAFVNGSVVGSGDSWADNPPKAFPLPPGTVNGARYLVAIRIVHPKQFVRPGVFPYEDKGPYLVAPAGWVESAVRAEIGRKRRETSLYLGGGVVLLVSGICVLVVWRLARDWPVFFWLTVFLLGQAWNTLRPGLFAGSAHPYLLYPTAGLTYPCLVEVLLAVLKIRTSPWRPISWLLAFAMQVGALFSPAAYTNFLLIATALILGISIFGIWARRGATRWMCLFTAAYMAAILLQNGVLAAAYISLGSQRFAPSSLVSVPGSLILVLLLLKQLISDRREKERLAHEFEAARVVQQLLIGQQQPTSDTYSIEALYHPAQEVGGDFYYWLHGSNGALLLVVGDVSGKGLKAAMLVSLIIGALRRTTDDSPDRVLASLNEAVYGQTGAGFVTCCCARFESDGTVALANAGHVPPYIGTVEATISGGLPLGLTNQGSYEESTFRLAARAGVTFVSDGVVEAANASNELFGFERTRAIADQPAHDIVAAAQAFGQNDDITVVTVRRRA